MSETKNLVGSEVDVEVAGKTYPGYVESEKDDGLSVILYGDKDKRYKVFSTKEIISMLSTREELEGYRRIDLVSPDEEVMTSMRFTDAEYSYFEAAAERLGETFEEFIISSIKTGLESLEEKLAAQGK